MIKTTERHDDDLQVATKSRQQDGKSFSPPFFHETRQKKAKFFIIKTGMLLFLTGDASCQKMLTLWGQTIFFPSMSEF